MAIEPQTGPPYSCKCWSPEWEKQGEDEGFVDIERFDRLCRMQVPGGWLYKNWSRYYQGDGLDGVSISIAFVPHCRGA